MPASSGRNRSNFLRANKSANVEQPSPTAGKRSTISWKIYRVF